LDASTRLAVRFASFSILMTLLGFSADVVAQEATGGASSAADPADREAPLPTAAQVQLRVGDPSLQSLGAALQRIVRSELEGLGTLRMSGTPALPLEDLQLMIGCLGETDECFAAMATQLEVDVVVLPSLDRVGDERVLTVVAFDRRDNRRRSARRAHPDDEALAGSVRSLLRELYELPPEPEPEPLPPVEPREPVEAPSRGPGIVPGVVIGAVGLATLGAALGVGLASGRAEDDYREASVRTVEEVDAALARRSDAARLGTTATALYVAGGALTIAGVVLAVLFGREKEDDARALRLVPQVGPSSIGLVVGGAL
jgi:hypothetical protein